MAARPASASKSPLRRSTSSICGQPSAQSPQKLHPPDAKSSQGMPAKVCSAGCLRIIPAEQLDTQSPTQPAQTSAHLPHLTSWFGCSPSSFPDFKPCSGPDSRVRRASSHSRHHCKPGGHEPRGKVCLATALRDAASSPPPRKKARRAPSGALTTGTPVCL